MTTTEITTRLEEYADWAEANSYEVPIMLPDTLREAKALIEQMSKAGAQEPQRSAILFNILLSLNHGNSGCVDERVRYAIEQYDQFMAACKEDI